MPMNLRCMICKCTRRSLSAATAVSYTHLVNYLDPTATALRCQAAAVACRYLALSK